MMKFACVEPKLKLITYFKTWENMRIFLIESGFKVNIYQLEKTSDIIDLSNWVSDQHDKGHIWITENIKNLYKNIQKN